MATISELNIRLGLITRDFDRQLRAVESRLRASGQAMADLGSRMSLSITAPLAGIGAAAVKSAGDMESLRLAMESTFTSNKRSIAEAHAELEALRKAALAPGLDFEQAVKASIRLQSVGYSAEAARKVISELANTIAMTGGTAENFDSVTVQMTQMIGKGKVLSQDLRIMVENMPKLADLMLKTFGTTNTEAIQKIGISGKEFVDRITEAASGLDRVRGGIKNAFVNAAAAAQQALATLGETLIKTFNITGKLDALSNSLTDVVDWFKGLTAGTQAAIGWTAAFVAALGPLIWAFGQIKLTGVALIGFYVKGLLPALASAKVFALQAAVAFETLGAAQKLVIAVAVAYAIAKIVEAIVAWNTALTDTQKLERAVYNVQQEAQRSISKEKTELGLLTKTLENNNISMADREAALKRLQQISPEYFGNLKIEKGLVVGLDAAVKGYVGSITRAATAQAAFAKIQDLANEKIDQQNELTKEASLLTKVQAAVAGAVSPGGEKAVMANRHAGTLQRIKDIEAEQAALEKLITENGGLTNALDAGSAATKTNTILTQEQIDAKEKAAAASKKMSDTLKDVEKSIDAVNKKQAELGADFVGEKTREIEAGVEKLIEAGFGPGSAPVQKLKGYLKQIRAEISAGFGAPNATQAATGIGPAEPAQIATLPTPGTVGSLSIPGADQAIEQARKMSEAWEKAGGSFDDFAARIESKKTPLEQVKTAFADLKNGTISWVDALNKVSETYSGMVSSVINSAASIAANLLTIQKNKGDQEKAQLDEEYAYKISAAQGNADETARLQQELAAKKAAIDKKVAQNEQKIAIVKAVMDTAGGVVKALGSAPPPYNFILAALTAAAGAVQIATIKSQKFAGGVVATKPTFGMFGEYPGAQRNPEIVTPERLMRSIFRDESANAGGMVQVYGTIRGADILLSSEKATRERGRYR